MLEGRKVLVMFMVSVLVVFDMLLMQNFDCKVKVSISLILNIFQMKVGMVLDILLCSIVQLQSVIYIVIVDSVIGVIVDMSEDIMFSMQVFRIVLKLELIQVNMILFFY